ncbi:hypothetical protein [Deinococcus sp.]|uniref:hypothetical protein n=1 Tax=Deinococcus sp. TaxID=47478 RepID=UPI003C7CC31B
MPRDSHITVSLPAPLLAFVDDYASCHTTDRNEVIVQAVKAFQDAELARSYRESGAEMQADPLFDLDSGHGLEREAPISSRRRQSGAAIFDALTSIEGPIEREQSPMQEREELL